jgi:hypothetical protein
VLGSASRYNKSLKNVKTVENSTVHAHMCHPDTGGVYVGGLWPSYPFASTSVESKVASSHTDVPVVLLNPDDPEDAVIRNMVHKLRIRVEIGYSPVVPQPSKLLRPTSSAVVGMAGSADSSQGHVEGPHPEPIFLL